MSEAPSHIKELDIVLPCYNPPQGWAQMVIDGISLLKKDLPGVAINVFVVNDGSMDKVDSKELQYLHKQLSDIHYLGYEKNKGKGYALRYGVTRTRADYTIITDIDIPYTVPSMLAIVQELQKGTDVAVGNRPDKYYDSVPGFRKGMSQMLRWMLRTFLRLEIGDSQCGLKGFNKEGRTLFLSTQIDEFLIDLEFIVLASRHPRVGIKPVTVHLREGIEFTKMPPSVLVRELLNFAKIYLRTLKG